MGATSFSFFFLVGRERGVLGGRGGGGLWLGDRSPHPLHIYSITSPTEPSVGGLATSFYVPV